MKIQLCKTEYQGHMDDEKSMIKYNLEVGRSNKTNMKYAKYFKGLHKVLLLKLREIDASMFIILKFSHKKADKLLKKKKEETHHALSYMLQLFIISFSLRGGDGQPSFKQRYVHEAGQLPKLLQIQLLLTLI